jgi:heme/copper-type cytochrome/quinol oxidase subunit 4
MLEILYVIIAGGVATLFMTTFSYLLSTFTNKRFREPLLINYLIRGSQGKDAVGKRSFWGYVIHFLIGYAFTFAYFAMYKSGVFELGLESGGIYGLCIGLIGAVAWKIMFRMNDNPPEISMIPYLFQLVVAHVIFGLSLAWILLLLYAGKGYG